MRAGNVALLSGLLLLAPAMAVKQTKATVKKTTAKKSRATRRVARRIPKAPPVTAKQRAEASETVSGMIDQAAEMAIENPAAMVPFFELLYRNQSSDVSEPLRILQFGDSHTASDDWTASVRTLLQERFGDGGGGYSFAGRPFKSYRRHDLKTASTRGWKPVGLLAREGDGLYGLGGVGIATSLPGQTVSLQAECHRLELFYLQQPDGGDLTLFDNGAPAATISTGGDLGPGFFEYTAEPGPHQFELKTTERAPVRLFGWVTEKDKGVTYEPLGINGAQASVIFRWDENLLASHIARRNPALIVLAYGTNEATSPDWAYENYREMFSALLARLRQAAPVASILVLGPPDRYVRSRGKWTPLEKLDRIVKAQREAAFESGCAFWDLREKMGGAGAMRQWVIAGLAQYDHVHFTSPGYRRLGHVLFRDLMYNYEKYTKARADLAAMPPPAPLSAALPDQPNGQTSANR